MKPVQLAATAAAALLGALAFAGAAQAQVAVGLNIGTSGVGLQAETPLTDSIVLRGALDYLSFEHDDTYDDIDYTGDLKTSTAGAFLDWHPGGGGFFISAGAYVGKREAEIRGTPNGNVEIGDTTYTPAEVGTLVGSVRMSDLQPFLGLGFDNAIARESGWGFRAMAGASFSDDPDVSLACSGGTLCASPAFQADLDAERQAISDDADNFKLYPILQVGITYKY